MVNWNIVQLERQSDDDLVTVVHWEATLAEEVVNGEETKVYSSRVYGCVSLERGDTFTPFVELTKELVVGWVKDKLGEEEVTRFETSLQNQINEQKTPQVLKGLPW